MAGASLPSAPARSEQWLEQRHTGPKQHVQGMWPVQEGRGGTLDSQAGFQHTSEAPLLMLRDASSAAWGAFSWTCSMGTKVAFLRQPARLAIARQQAFGHSPPQALLEGLLQHSRGRRPACAAFRMACGQGCRVTLLQHQQAAAVPAVGWQQGNLPCARRSLPHALPCPPGEQRRHPLLQQPSVRP